MRVLSGGVGAALLPAIGFLIGLLLTAFYEDDKNPLVGTLIGVGVSLAFARNELLNRLQNITEVSKLYAEVERCAVDNQSIVDLMRAATRVDNSRFHKLSLRFVNSQIGELTQLLSDFSNLTATKAGAQLGWLIELSRLSERSIYAISTMEADGDFWDDPGSKSYLRPQCELAKTVGEGAVKRIFVLPSELRSGGALGGTAKVVDAMRRQQADGIQVRYLFNDEFVVSGAPDVVIFDEEIIVTTFAGPRGSISTTSVDASDDAVHEALSVFHEMWAAGREIESQSGWATGTSASPWGTNNG